MNAIFAWLVLFNLLACSEPPVMQPIEKHRFSTDLIIHGQLSEDAQHLLLQTSKSAIQLWDVESKQKLIELSHKQLPPSIRALKYDKAHQLLLVAGDNRVQIWDMKDLSIFGVLKAKGMDSLARVETLSISERGGLIAVGLSDGSVIVFNLANKFSHIWKVHDSSVVSLLFGPADLYITSTGHDGRVVRWSLKDGQVSAQKDLPSRISSFAINEQNRYVFVSDVLTNQYVLDSHSLDEVTQLTYLSRFRWFRKALFVPETPYLITSSPKSDISIWNFNTGEEVSSWSAETLTLGSTVYDMRINQNKLFTLSSESVLEIWKLDTLLPKH